MKFGRAVCCSIPPQARADDERHRSATKESLLHQREHDGSTIDTTRNSYWNQGGGMNKFEANNTMTHHEYRAVTDRAAVEASAIS